MRALAAIFLTTFLSLCSVAVAQQTITRQVNPLFRLTPENGGYFDPTKPGNGIMVEVADDGFVFGAFFYYDALGVGKWNTIQGFCEPASEHIRMTTDVLCRVTASAMFEARDGQCWGCPWRQNSNFASTDMNTGVEAVFFSPNRGELRANGAVLPLQRLSELYPGQAVSDRLVGKWARTRYAKARNCSNCPEYIVSQSIGTVEIRPIAARINFLNVANPGGFPTNLSVSSLPVFPSTTVPQFEVACLDDGGIPGGCPRFGSEGSTSQTEVVYIEQNSSQIRLVSICTNRNLPNCVVIEGPVGALVTSNAILDRENIYLSKGKIGFRPTRTTGGQLVLAEEETWTKLEAFTVVPSTADWPL